jgi:hypothetical protein
MIALIVIAAACVAMWKIAEVEGRSPLAWAAITFGLCIVSLAIPLPFFNILIGAVLAFVLMFVMKIVAER